jgi:hypothetical protein
VPRQIPFDDCTIKALELPGVELTDKLKQKSLGDWSIGTEEFSGESSGGSGFLQKRIPRSCSKAK